jgi:hypothetical protein
MPLTAPGRKVVQNPTTKSQEKEGVAVVFFLFPVLRNDQKRN